jgi:acyl-ACP thioesterase
MLEKETAPAVHQEEYALRSVDCAADGSMRLDAVFEILQEAAGYHADLCGAGFADLIPAGMTWILSRIRVRVTAYPRYRERLLVRTWPRGTQGLIALRDFIVSGPGGSPAVLGTSSWLLVDYASRRPLRADEFLAGRFSFSGERALDADASKIADFAAAPSGAPALGFRVRPSDLDMNGHVTNTAYIKMLADGLAETSPGSPPLDVEVNFMAEAFLGEELHLAFVSAGDGARPVRAKLLSPDGSKEYVRFALGW